MSTHERPLGMLRPPDDRHRRLFTLTDATIPAVPTPCVMGVNWYSRYDSPQDDVDSRGRHTYWVGRGSDWGRVRGGHAICIASPHLSDLVSWWQFYDQGNEGACVGFSLSRAMTNLNRRRYAAQALYERARQVDDWEGEDYSGTSVRAGCDVLRDLGARPTRMVRGVQTVAPWLAADGIAANRWGRDIADIAMCLSPDDNGAMVLDRGWVELLNSWGQDGYPHKTRISLEALDRLIFRESGEVTVIVDR